jgi:hypothetical protein
MPSWNGFDGDDSAGELPPSPSPSSPFSTAFHTPRPPGIQTGVRDISPSLGQYPEDLYAAFEVKFNKATIKTPNRRNKTRLTFEESGHVIRHLTMTETTWRDLPTSEKGIQERSRRAKALKYFEMKGTLLMRKPETVAPRTDNETHLSLRQAALDDDVYYVIKQTHEQLGYTGYKKTHKAVRRDVYGINRERRGG